VQEHTPFSRRLEEEESAMTLIRPTGRLPLLPSPSDRRERRRLAQEDRRGAMLATLARVRDVLVDADPIVARGWVQEAWYVSRDTSGQEWAFGVPTGSVGLETITRSCLVGAVVLAAGGPDAAASPPASRAIEALWHALHRRVDEPVDWRPPAVVHGGHVRDLIRWNDSPWTSQASVRFLLAQGRDVVARERERLLTA
jgi:hypothetical protein